ncbi:hypothetical protein CUJ83_00015 [Methanocella sp. CWC-04]|uniref:DUF2795 domain-containing protein n=1 Tax=Methanooceanicella nereidis TaxID=2052831 RepID=A0AAP2W4L6_9EURY|nr:DUF2795 domain-containing protein [Methanocella sp. CWC-04]MCD1293382.1 hypothetical protein [Methanocella sp. CWC-04]
MVSTAKISRYLKGITFPANKEECIDRAKRQDAPGDVMNALNHMSDGIYTNMGNIWYAVKKQQ